MGIAWIFKKLLFGRVLDADRGRISLFGSMAWTMVPAEALAVNLQMIGEKCGENFLYKLGYEGGKAGAKELIRFMGLEPKGGWATQRVVISLLDFLGYGRPGFYRANVKENGRHHVIIHVTDNPVVEHALHLFGRKSKVCSWFRGIYAAHGEMELGLKNVRLTENTCICKGSKYCEWESKW